MQQFMVTMQCPRVLTETFIGLIPQQRAKVVELMARGSLTSYSLSHDRATLWATMAASSEDEVRDLLNQFPLTAFMDSVVIQPLMFHNSLNWSLPQFSLN